MEASRIDDSLLTFKLIQHFYKSYLLAYVVGEQGSADTAFRDSRGFAIKLNTKEGNLDLVGFNTPMFSIRDHIQATRYQSTCVWY